LVNLPPGALVYKVSATETRVRGQQEPGPPDVLGGMMARSHANFWGKQTPAAAQADCPRRALAVYPLRP
jgi:hypothetical protein